MSYAITDEIETLLRLGVKLDAAVTQVYVKRAERMLRRLQLNVARAAECAQENIKSSCQETGQLGIELHQLGHEIADNWLREY